MNTSIRLSKEERDKADKLARDILRTSKPLILKALIEGIEEHLKAEKYKLLRDSGLIQPSKPEQTGENN